MSVDYLLHLVHSYKQQRGGPQQRVRGALEEMGVSVTGGMITTFIACIALFLTEMLWFKLFGCFIAMVILSAFFVAMVGMMALLAEFGPGSEEENVEGAPCSSITVSPEAVSSSSSSGGGVNVSSSPLVSPAPSPEIEMKQLETKDGETRWF
jgi:predicted RND superfamily exporter protein